MPSRASPGATGSRVQTASFPMQTPWSLAPISAPHIQAGLLRTTAWVRSTWGIWMYVHCKQKWVSGEAVAIKLHCTKELYPVRCAKLTTLVMERNCINPQGICSRTQSLSVQSHFPRERNSKENVISPPLAWHICILYFKTSTQQHHHRNTAFLRFINASINSIQKFRRSCVQNTKLDANLNVLPCLYETWRAGFAQITKEFFFSVTSAGF